MASRTYGFNFAFKVETDRNLTRPEVEQLVYSLLGIGQSDASAAAEDESLGTQATERAADAASLKFHLT